jgi:hypothetical protein
MPLCFQTTAVTNDYSVAKKIYSYDEMINRIKACGINVAGADGDVISHQRIIFGQDFNNNAGGAPANTTVNATITQGGFTYAAGHKPNLDHFRKLRQIARIGNRITKTNFYENAIKPVRSSNPEYGYMTDNYIILLSEASAACLIAQDDWKAQINRGVIENKNQPSLFRGGSYLGTIEGMMFVVEPELDKYAIADNTHISLLLGQGAIAHGMSGSPDVTVEVSNHGKRYEIAHHETVGIRPIHFNSKMDITKKGTNPLLIPHGIVVGIAKTA